MTAYGGNVKAELELGTDKFSAAWKKVINDLNSTPTPSGPAKIQKEVDKLAAGVSKSSSTAQSAIQKMGTTYDSVVQKMQNSTNATVQRIGNQLDALGQRFNPNRIQDKFDSVMRKLPSTAQSAVSKVVSNFDAISSRVNFNRISDKFDATIRQMASSARSGVSNITSSFSSMETGIAGILGTVTAGLGISQLFEMGQAKAVTQQMLSNMGKSDFFGGYEAYTLKSATSDADINRMFQWVAQTQGLQSKDVERALSAIDAASYSTDPINRLRDQTAWAKYIQGGWATAAGAMRDEPLPADIKRKMQEADTAEERIAVAEEFARLRGTMDAFGYNLSTTTDGAVGDFNAALVGVDNLSRSLREAFTDLLHALRPAIDWFNQLDGPTQKLIGQIILGASVLIGFMGALKLVAGALSPLKGILTKVGQGLWDAGSKIKDFVAGRWGAPTGTGTGGSSTLTKIAGAAIVIGVAYISAELIKWSIERLNDPNYTPTAGGKPLSPQELNQSLLLKSQVWGEWNKNPLMRMNPFMPVGLDVGLQNYDISTMLSKVLFSGIGGQTLKDSLFPKGGFGSLFSGMIQGKLDLGKWASDGLGWLKDNLFKSFQGRLDLGKWASDGLKWIRDKINQIRGNFSISHLASQALNWVRNKINQLRGSFNISSLASSAINWVRNKINQLRGSFNISGLASNAWGWVRGKVNNIFGSFNISALASQAWSWVRSRLNFSGSMSSVTNTMSNIASRASALIAQYQGPGNSSPNQKGFISRARGVGDSASNFLDNMFSTFKYEEYEGSRKSISQTLKDMSGNCVDGTFAQVWMAGQLGVPMGMDFTTWNGTPHVLGVTDTGRPRDVANRAITGSWDRPPAGPGDSGGYGGVFIAKGAVQIQGDINGIKDAEKTMEKVFIRMANKYLA